MQTPTERILVFICLSVLIVFLTACSLNEDPPEESLPGNVLRIDVNLDFGSFNPACTDCSGATYVFPFTYSYLCVPNPEGGMEPDLAVSWDYNPKMFIWRIQLRQDARFHNGALVTAADAAYSIRAFADNTQKAIDQKIESITPIAKYELEVRLKMDDPLFLNSIWDLEIIPDLRRYAGLDLANSPVGSGPFKFQIRTDDGRIILAANENYYKGRPAIDEVIFYHEPIREKSWTRLIAGKTDIVGDLTVKNYEMIRQYADLFYFAKYYYNYYSILLYNTRHPLFQNPMVRRALTHAINRDYIVRDMLYGMAEVVASPMGNHSDSHDPELKPLAYDPYLALEYLKKAGWTLDSDTQCQVKDGQMFEFDLLLPEGSDIEGKVARYIKLNLNEVGIRVHQKVLPPYDLYKRYYQNTEFDAVLIEMPSHDRKPRSIYDVWVTKGNVKSIAGGFDSPEIGLLASLVINTKDQGMKRVFFQRFDELIADLQPGSFLFQKIFIDAMSKRFVLKYPFTFDCEGLYRMQYARLKNER